MAVGQNKWYHFGVGAPPILEPVLVGIGMFTGSTIWILPIAKCAYPKRAPPNAAGASAGSAAAQEVHRAAAAQARGEVGEVHVTQLAGTCAASPPEEQFDTTHTYTYIYIHTYTYIYIYISLLVLLPVWIIVIIIIRIFLILNYYY